MKEWFESPLLRTLLVTGIWLWVGYSFGIVALVVSSPLYGWAMARCIYALAGSGVRKMREMVWLPVHGQHYVYKGTTIRVLEDESHARWICLDDVRKVVGDTASERSLAATYPGRCERGGDPPLAHVRDDALITHLGKQGDLANAKFRTWVERTIALPGRNVRERMGIRLDPNE